MRVLKESALYLQNNKHKQYLIYITLILLEFLNV